MEVGISRTDSARPNWTICMSRPNLQHLLVPSGRCRAPSVPAMMTWCTGMRWESYPLARPGPCLPSKGHWQISFRDFCLRSHGSWRGLGSRDGPENSDVFRHLDKDRSDPPRGSNAVLRGTRQLGRGVASSGCNSRTSFLGGLQPRDSLASAIPLASKISPWHYSALLSFQILGTCEPHPDRKSHTQGLPQASRVAGSITPEADDHD